MRAKVNVLNACGELSQRAMAAGGIMEKVSINEDFVSFSFLFGSEMNQAILDIISQNTADTMIVQRCRESISIVFRFMLIPSATPNKRTEPEAEMVLSNLESIVKGCGGAKMYQDNKLSKVGFRKTASFSCEPKTFASCNLPKFFSALRYVHSMDCYVHLSRPSAMNVVVLFDERSKVVA